MHAPVELLLGKPAIGAGDHVLAPDKIRESHDPLGDQLGMLHHVRAVADHTGRQHFAFGKFYILPDAPFVLVARVGRLDQVCTGAYLEDQVDDFLERHIGGMRPRPASPANMIAHPVLGNSFERVVEHFDVPGHPAVIVVKARRGNHAVVGHRGARVIHLQQKARVHDRLVLGSQRFGERYDQIFIGFVVFVSSIRNGARGCGDRQKRFFHAHVLERRLEVRDVAIEFLEAGVSNGRDADGVVCGDLGPGALVRLFQLRVEFRKTFAVGAAREGIGARPDGPLLEAAQAFQGVKRPTGRLTEFAVIDDVDTRSGLLAYGVGDRLSQAFFVGPFIDGLAVLAPAFELEKLRRPDQAADVGCEYAMAAAFHNASQNGLQL